MSTFTPKPYQKLIIKHIIEHPRCAVWAGMGMGKTISTLKALEAIKYIEPLGKVLVLAPLRVCVSTWGQEAAKWGVNLKTVVVTGSVAQRKKALYTDADIYCINYDNIEWLVNYLGDHWNFRTIVADESTRLKSFRTRQGGKRAKALSTFAFTRVKRFIELTGTPTPNGLLDLWGQMYFVDQGEALGRTFTAYRDRWFYTNNYSKFSKPIPFEHSPREIEDRVKKYIVSVRPEDYFDLKEPIINNIYVDLPPKARKTYDSLLREMYAAFENDLKEHKTIEAVNAAARTMKCLQCAAGIVKAEDGAWHVLHDEKVEALKSIIEEASGAPVLVAYHFNEDKNRLLKEIPEARFLDKDPKTIEEWNAGKIPVLLVHPQSAGHGLNLQYGGNIVVFYGLWWDLEAYQQVLERVGPVRQLQAGFNRNVFIYNIVARATLDETVLESRTTKASVQELLLKNMSKVNFIN